MPGSDRTGPRGQGPMTGRGQGYCETSNNSDRQQFWGFGGFGRRWRNRFFNSGTPGRIWGRWSTRIEPDLSAKTQVDMLQNEANYFEHELKNIREEIDRLKKNDSENRSRDVIGVELEKELFTIRSSDNQFDSDLILRGD